MEQTFRLFSWLDKGRAIDDELLKEDLEHGIVMARHCIGQRAVFALLSVGRWGYAPRDLFQGKPVTHSERMCNS